MLACNAQTAGSLLANESLKSIDYGHLATVNILLDKAAVESSHWVNDPKVVHVLYPDSHPTSEVMPQQFHYMSNLFPGAADRAHVTLTVAIDSKDISDEAIRNTAIACLGVTEQAIMDVDISRLWNALPIFRPGHMVRVREANEHLPANISLVGNYFGWTSITGCLALSKHVAAKINSAKL